MDGYDNLTETFTGILDDFEAGFGVRTMFRDCSGLFRTHNDKPLVLGRPRHLHPYCMCGRMTEENWDTNCLRDCRFRVESMGFPDGLPVVTDCWKGVREVVVPIMHGNLRAAIIQAGVFKGNGVPDGVPEPVRGLYMGLGELTEAKALTLGRMLHTLGQDMLARLLKQHGGGGEAPTRQLRIREYVVRKAHERVNLKDLATELNLSPYRTSHLVSELFGSSLQELVIEERVKRAKTLLGSTDSGIGAIANRVGFETPGHFTRKFKELTGMTPLAYRRGYQATVNALHWK